MIRESAIVFWNSDQVIDKNEVKEIQKSDQMRPDVDGFIGQHKEAESNYKKLVLSPQPLRV